MSVSKDHPILGEIAIKCDPPTVLSLVTASGSEPQRHRQCGHVVTRDDRLAPDIRFFQIGNVHLPRLQPARAPPLSSRNGFTGDHQGVTPYCPAAAMPLVILKSRVLAGTVTTRTFLKPFWSDLRSL